MLGKDMIEVSKTLTRTTTKKMAKKKIKPNQKGGGGIDEKKGAFTLV